MDTQFPNIIPHQIIQDLDLQSSVDLLGQYIVLATLGWVQEGIHKSVPSWASVHYTSPLMGIRTVHTLTSICIYFAGPNGPPYTLPGIHTESSAHADQLRRRHIEPRGAVLL